MKKWCLVIDVEKCENCNNCFLSCKDEHFGNDWPGYSLSQPLHGHRWIEILQKEHGHFPLVRVAYKPKPCFHCDDAPCIEKVADGEIYKRPDGIVIIDPVKAHGKKELVSACPFGAIWWNEENSTPQKCTMCSHLLDTGWKAPRCVQACPTGALSIHHVEDAEFKDFIVKNDLRNDHQKSIVAGNSVLYKNIDLFEKCSIFGSVAIRLEENEDCVEGAEVKLYKEQALVDTATTDGFGDFSFSGLPEQSGTYNLQVTHRGQHQREIEVILGGSLSLGTLWL